MALSGEVVSAISETYQALLLPNTGFCIIDFGINHSFPRLLIIPFSRMNSLNRARVCGMKPSSGFRTSTINHSKRQHANEPPLCQGPSPIQKPRSSALLGSQQSDCQFPVLFVNPFDLQLNTKTDLSRKLCCLH